MAPCSPWSPDLEVVAEVGRGDEVVAAAEQTHPDLALRWPTTAWSSANPL
jgi:hypothetical protein